MRELSAISSIAREEGMTMIPGTNHIPFGYNADGSHNERESEVIRFVFSKYNEYFFNPPQQLIEEAHAWAASEGFSLNDEEAQDMARARLAAYIAVEVSKRFPDVHYRKADPARSSYPVGLKYPSRAFNESPVIDRDLYVQVQHIISNG